MARPLLVGLVALQLACYSYVPAALETLPAKSDVRALLNDDGQERLRSVYRVTMEGPVLRGSLLGLEGDSAGFFVQSVPFGSGVGTRPLYQQVQVARADILRVDLRRVNAMRTAAVAAIGAGVVAIAAVKALTGGQTVATGGGPPPPAERRGTWRLQIPLPWP